MRRGLLALGALALLGLSLGCQTTEPTPRGQSMRIDSTDPDLVLEVAAVVLEPEFGRVEPPRTGDTLTAGPYVFTTHSSGGTARDLYGAPTRMRRTAHLRVSPVGGGTVATLRIDVERHDTQRRAATQPPTGRLRDQAAPTPIEEDAALREEQRQVWTFVRRDVALERQLLTELRNRFAPAETAAEPVTTTDQ